LWSPGCVAGGPQRSGRALLGRERGGWAGGGGTPYAPGFVLGKR